MLESDPYTHKIQTLGKHVVPHKNEGCSLFAYVVGCLVLFYLWCLYGDRVKGWISRFYFQTECEARKGTFHRRGEKVWCERSSSLMDIGKA